MDMRCSVYLRPPLERQIYIDTMMTSLIKYYRVKDENKERFLAEPKIRKVKKALKSINMSMDDIVSYLGEGFYCDGAREREGDDNAK